jgi:hypothetical protein
MKQKQNYREKKAGPILLQERHQEMEERRKHTRRVTFRVNNPLPQSLVFWRGKSGMRETAYICDVSLGGCFLNTTGLANMDDSVVVEFPTPDAQIAEIEGIVVAHQRKLSGFGVRFPSLSEKQQTIIERLLMRESDQLDRRDDSRSGDIS